jgi:aspartate kinase
MEFGSRLAGSGAEDADPRQRQCTGDTLVLKFGGASLATGRRVRLAARRIAAHSHRGRRVVAVVSAAGRSTDAILTRAAALSGGVARSSRELDRALATGEDRSAALLALALESIHVRARSLRGGEAGLLARGPFGRGRIRCVVPDAILQVLDAGVVPVVSGFQAARQDGEVVTLGRGASDTTAVALAAALGAECHLVKEVAAVYDTDPRTSAGAHRLGRMNHGELVALAAAGAKVVQSEAALLARREGVLLRVYAFDAPLSGRGGTVVTAAVAAA